MRVLIADDYADAAESLAMFLSNTGAQIEIAMDGDKALERALEWRPHVCVLDLAMPRRDGRDVARGIREHCGSARPLLIALTGWTGAEDRQSAVEAGFDYYLTKPLHPEQLVRIIQSYLVEAMNGAESGEKTDA
jgi:CheY-like chemotaxis protein